MPASLSQVSVQDVDSDQFQQDRSSNKFSYRSIFIPKRGTSGSISSSNTSTSSLGKESTRTSISSRLKRKSKDIFNAIKIQNSPSEAAYQTKSDYLLFRK